MSEKKIKYQNQVKRNDFDNLTYHYKCSTTAEKYDDFDNAFILFDKTKNGEMMLQDAIRNQNRFKS